MTRNDTEIVRSLREALIARVTRERFDLWFANVRFQLDGDNLQVGCSDQFTLDRLRASFRRELSDAARQVFCRDISIEFSIVESAPKAKQLLLQEATKPAVSPAEESKPKHKQPIAQGATLNSFVVGDCNCVAYTAASMVMKRLGAVSPLFLHGPPGSGKTHLLDSVWHAARRGRQVRRVVRLSAEQFTTYFLEALQGRGLPSFRRKYRDVELLLIDDVQFFAGKRATLVEVQHTIDALLRDGRQLVMTADRSPAELHGMGAELTARMSGGLACGLEPANQRIRLQILKNAVKQRKCEIPASVLNMVAEFLPGDARQLFGALNRLEATSEALGKPITMQLAEAALADIFRGTQRIVRLPDIDRAICDVFGLDPDALKSGRKAKSVSQPRMLAMWLARKYTRAAFSEIGEFFGHRTHSTVISAQKKVNRWVSDGETIRLAAGTCNVAEAIRHIESQLRTG